MTIKGKLSTEAYKGVRDFYPEDEAVQKYLFSTMRKAVEKFGYVEYHASILEPAELYRGKTSEEIVNEQTYTFVDRGEREVTLRPEMTPTVARLVAAKRRELAFPVRWYSIPNVFRYERPQRGRLREHWQLNVDLFGSGSIVADAEIISVAYAVMKAFGAADSDFEIRVGSRAYLNAIIEKTGLSKEHGKKLLGLFDRREKMPAETFDAALQELGVSPDAFSSASVPEDAHELLSLLEQMGVENTHFDERVVRGFEYYTGIVFEVFDKHPENNRSLFGGGRYDNLLQLFGEEQVPAVGFGMGDVTMRDFLAVRGLIPPYVSPTKVYLAVASDDATLDAMKIAAELRTRGVNTAVDFGDKKLGDQIRVADKQKIPYLIVVGRDEIESGQFAVRDMTTRTEKMFSRADLGEFFLNLENGETGK